MAAGARGTLPPPGERARGSTNRRPSSLPPSGFRFRLPSAAPRSGRSRRADEWPQSLVPIKLSAGVRRFATSAIRRSHYEEGPGKNLPFSVDNKWRLLAMMCAFFGSGFGAPFFIVRHQLLKKWTGCSCTSWCGF
ncbi:cytochrome c oxidase subunit 7C, mitochondrial [Aphelocoma coerulescens]|uniref:cytochrome c oxidase subunit 7C, mitochondrial n=1 Tax=Aphelocoma coerulescens TaxID=39617 RepID=UPI00360447F8